MRVIQRQTLSDMLTIAVALDERGPMTKTEIAKVIEMSRGKVSALVDNMCQAMQRYCNYRFLLEKDNPIKRVGPKKTPSCVYKIKVLECIF